jgi:tRNA nucleotidyltransferase (CCA-adding enzyme)
MRKVLNAEVIKNLYIPKTNLIMLLQSVLKRIRPTETEIKEVEEFVRELLRISKTVTGLDSVICGSLGKFTWIRGDHDIDLFMLFPKTASREELEKKGLLFGKRIVSAMRGSYVIKYAEHPYVHARINGFDVDIVPCYRIKKGEAIKSAVDRSPLHLEYVIEKLKPESRDEVRLLKQFCKGIGVYGSDAKNLGFSGYICELLIIKYGTFMNTLKAAAKWSVPQAIATEAAEIKKFLDQTLIVIDPTDTNRNAAANLSAENTMKFINASKRFLEKQSVNYFFPTKPKKLSKSETRALQKRGTNFIAIRFRKPDIIDDILYLQLRRAMKRLCTLLRYNEFIVLRSYEFVSEDVLLAFELEVWKLPNIKKMIGPPIFSQRHSNEFLKKYKFSRPYIDGTRWVAEVQRENRTAFDLLRRFIRRGIKHLESDGIPKNIAREFSKAELLEDKEFWRFVKSNGDFSAFLRKKYFEGL